jgi:DNA-binding MarR family transcriptional regulator
MPASTVTAGAAPVARMRAPATTTIHDLLSYRLGVISGLLSRSAALRYRREFGVSLWEWRAIALLGAGAPMSLNELATGAGLDKSQMSRVVSVLTERGHVLREVDARDGRGVRLALSRSGRRVHAGLMRAAGERDARLRGCIPAADRVRLERLLAALQACARELWVEERAAGERAQPGRRRARDEGRS